MGEAPRRALQVPCEGAIMSRGARNPSTKGVGAPSERSWISLVERVGSIASTAGCRDALEHLLEELVVDAVVLRVIDGQEHEYWDAIDPRTSLSSHRNALPNSTAASSSRLCPVTTTS